MTRALILIALAALVGASCPVDDAGVLGVGCTSNDNCSSCAIAPLMQTSIWFDYGVEFVCKAGRCYPDLSSGNASSANIAKACAASLDLCCVPGVNASAALAMCNKKTCGVLDSSSGSVCSAVGQCTLARPFAYRNDSLSCCRVDSDCEPRAPDDCFTSVCRAGQCTTRVKFDGCCQTTSQCALSTSLAAARCARSLCVPQRASFADPMPLSACVFGIDANCTCAVDGDCNDMNDCTIDRCDFNTHRCTNAFNPVAGGSQCCSGGTAAYTQCINGDPCTEIIGCNDAPLVDAVGNVLLPPLTCRTLDQRPTGCCTAPRDCSALRSATQSPCISSTCDASAGNMCDLNTQFTDASLGLSLPCCRDSTDCESGQQADVCEYYHCLSPLMVGVAPVDYFKCSLSRVPGCVTGEVTPPPSNAFIDAPTIPSNLGCSWVCGIPGQNEFSVRASISNPSLGAHPPAPLYNYFIQIVLNNYEPQLPGKLVDSIVLQPLYPFYPPTRYFPSDAFENTGGPIDQSNFSATLVYGVRNVPLYPDDVLKMQATVVLNAVAAAALTRLDFSFVLVPADVCSQALFGTAPGIDGTKCAGPSDVGKLIVRALLPSAPLVITFDDDVCPPVCATPLAAPTPPTTPPTGAPIATLTAPVTPPSAHATVAPVAGAVSGMAFFDAVGDGVFISTDAGVPNLLLTLSGFIDTSVVLTTRTDANGYFQFAGVNQSLLFQVSVSNSTLPYRHIPGPVLPNCPSGQVCNAFNADTLATDQRSLAAHQYTVYLGLVIAPACQPVTPPTTGGTGGLLVAVETHTHWDCTTCATNQYAPGSRCSPQRCADSRIRQSLTVTVNVDNPSGRTLKFNMLTVSLAAVGFDAHTLVPLDCAEAFDAGIQGDAFVVDTQRQRRNVHAAFSYGWNELPAGVATLFFSVQFVFCANADADALTFANVTAEIEDFACAAIIANWTRCDPTIDVRKCYSSSAGFLRPCYGCPATPAPMPPATDADDAAPVPTQLHLAVTALCANPLCVNNNTFAALHCDGGGGGGDDDATTTTTAAAMAQCSAAVNRGEALYRVEVANPSTAPSAEPVALRVTYTRHAATPGDALLCTNAFGKQHMPVYLAIDPSVNGTSVVERHEDAARQTLQFTVVAPALEPGQALIVTLVTFECSLYPLNVTFDVRLESLRCTPDALCNVTLHAPMPTLDATARHGACTRFRETGCFASNVDDLVAGFGVAPPRDPPNDGEHRYLPYVIFGLLLALILAATITYGVVRRRRQSAQNALAAKFSLAVAATASASSALRASGNAYHQQQQQHLIPPTITARRIVMP